MPNTEQKKQYLKQYYQTNKAKFAQYKRLQYWRKKALSLGEDNKTIMEITDIVELRKLCDEHLN